MYGDQLLSSNQYHVLLDLSDSEIAFFMLQYGQ